MNPRGRSTNPETPSCVLTALCRHSAVAYLVSRGWEPTIQDGDLEVLASGKPDFLAFNYYASHTVAAPLGGGSDVGDTGDQHIVMGEEGVYRAADGTVHDPYRIEYLAAHIEQIQWAVTDGVQVLGYCPWSAIDLVSTHQGVAKRYGFIYVDRDETDLKDLRRVKKDSFTWYRSVIDANGLPA